jgi:hypothetical protein
MGRTVMGRRRPSAFALGAAILALVAGCGRQVTGLNTPGGGGLVQPGETLIRFETVGPLDPTNYTYLIVFNTTGDGNEPYALGPNSNYKDWSYAFQVGGNTGYVSQPRFIEYYQDPTTASAAQPYTIQYTPNQLTFDTTLAGGLATSGFEIRFDRCLFDLPPPTSTGSATPAPTPRPVGSTCPPFTYGGAGRLTNTWTINLFTVDRTNTVVDSLGQGPSDTSFKLAPLDTTATVNDFQYIKPVTNSGPSSSSAQIYAVEIFNTPGASSSATPTPSLSPSPAPSSAPGT